METTFINNHLIVAKFKDIVDAVTVAMPYIAKKIVDGFNSIVEAVKSIVDNPMSAVTAMSRAIME